MKTAIALLVSILVAASSFGAEPLKSLVVRETDSSLVCKDDDGKDVELKKRPQRVIVCYASFVALWHLAGGQAIAIVDTVNKTNLPESARDIPTVGSFVSPNIEKMLELKPDLALLCGKIEKHRAVRDMLAERDIQSVILDYENYGDFLSLLDLFARLNGRNLSEIPEAAKVVADVDATVSKATKLKGPRFISLFASAKELSAEMANANTASMATLLGGVNVVGADAKKGSSTMKFSMERLLMEDPDLILFTTMGDAKDIQERMKRDLMSDPAWKGLRAAKDGCVFFLPNALFLYKPNEKFPEAFKHLAKIMYPEESW